jgi:FtsH-binding integral membrane protein
MDLDQTVSGVRTDADYDIGLRAFLISVYNRLAVGLLITAALAWLTGNTAFGNAFFHTLPNGKIDYTILGMAVCFGPIVLILVMGWLLKNTATRGGSAFLFYASSVMFGISSGVLFQIYTGMSLASTFVITSAMFGALSLWGYTTKRDLGPIGGFLFAALFGLIVAMIASIFIPGMHFIVSAIGVLIFSGFIAYDTQRLKSDYANGGDMVVRANLSAFNLYLDFINLFQFLLQFVGVRK